MKNAKSKSPGGGILQPIWCYHCRIRIAPYDPRTVFQGKDYHRDCVAKITRVAGSGRHQGVTR
ncbi:MAG: hypothetical protein DMG13_15325 [Acidobacteria bacterium]|nr:MAG: hypothetical protein DMG13_15325 [Acidobacteriota bacterium]